MRPLISYPQPDLGIAKTRGELSTFSKNLGRSDKEFLEAVDKSFPESLVPFSDFKIRFSPS